MKKEMVWALACMRERRVVYRVCSGNLRNRGYLEDLGIDGMKILKHTSRGTGILNELIWLTTWRVAGLL
jgi:hypothetical protein